MAQQGACGRGGLFGSGHRTGVGMGSGNAPARASGSYGSGNRTLGAYVGAGFRFLGA